MLELGFICSCAVPLAQRLCTTPPPAAPTEPSPPALVSPNNTHAHCLFTPECYFSVPLNACLDRTLVSRMGMLGSQGVPFWEWWGCGMLSVSGE